MFWCQFEQLSLLLLPLLATQETMRFGLWPMPIKTGWELWALRQNCKRWPMRTSLTWSPVIFGLRQTSCMIWSCRVIWPWCAAGEERHILTLLASLQKTFRLYFEFIANFVNCKIVDAQDVHEQYMSNESKLYLGIINNTFNAVMISSIGSDNYDDSTSTRLGLDFKRLCIS